MHEYDITLKSVLTRPTASVLTGLTGFTVARWHNVELPEVRNRRVDLIGESAEGSLAHIELQSTNDADMALRMLEYALAIYRQFRRMPTQIVLYVGEASLRMNPRLVSAGVHFECRIVDIRDIDGDRLLASGSLEDNIVAVLARAGDQRATVRRILDRIAANEPGIRARALKQLMILAGLRKLGRVIEQEIEQMPILDNIMDHEVLGRERKRGIAMGLEQGERKVVLRLILKRFGPVPEWAQQRLDSLAGPELERVELRLLDAASLEDLFA